MSYKVQPLAWLPNTHGYRFTGIRHDGTKAACRVVKCPDTGTHRIEGEATYQELSGWKA